MVELIEVPTGYTLSDYRQRINLVHALEALEARARELVPRLEGRTVWMLNSTAQGGGVAEMMPRLVSLLTQLGVSTRWAVMTAADPRFFRLTKQLHNMLHDADGAPLGDEAAALYAAENRRAADALGPLLGPRDILAVHDPQPLAAGAMLKAERGTPLLWRSHIGVDADTPLTRAAWAFLRPWALAVDRAAFSLWDYVPDFLRDRATVIQPSIDPLSHKNRELRVPKLTGILLDSGLAASPWPCVAPAFGQPVWRLQPDGSFAPALVPDDFGLLFRPLVVQVSRWDRLKGFLPLLEAFERLKAMAPRCQGRDRRVLELAGLVLAGPDPLGVADDPEAAEVLAEVSARWRALPTAVRDDVAVLRLPMASRKENALIVNALQRCASVVAQNSLREGFGLTATEAMWKGAPILATRAAGLRAQVRDGVEGRLVDSAEDAEAIALSLREMLTQGKRSDAWGHNARTRVAQEFLIFHQVQRWLEVLTELG